MAYIIPVLALILFIMSLTLFIFTGFTKNHLYFFFDQKWVNVVVVVRVLAGFLVLAGAPASGAPELMLVLGAGIIFIAFTTPFMSDEHLEAMAQWWQSLSTLVLKFWALLWMFIWFIFGYIALPKDSYIGNQISAFLSNLWSNIF